MKSQLTGKDPDAGKDWRPKEKRWLDGITDSIDMNLGQLQEMAERQEDLTCCSPQGHRVTHNLVTEHNQTNRMRIESPEINPHKYSQLTFNKGIKYTLRKWVSPTNSVAKTRYPHAKEYQEKKKTSKWIKDLHVRPLQNS